MSPDGTADGAAAADGTADGAREKSLRTAYVLCVLLGLLGAHKFYLGHQSAGVSYLLLTAVAYIGSLMGVGFVLAAVVIVLCLIDLFLLPEHVRKRNGNF